MLGGRFECWGGDFKRKGRCGSQIHNKWPDIETDEKPRKWNTYEEEEQVLMYETQLSRCFANSRATRAAKISKASSCGGRSFGMMQ